ncbi:hypothetical protein LTR66_016113 [Elasticomyces elasticus]|nr:hypothetical protein LTR66_016113 [Elasticomyces elasticus]
MTAPPSYTAIENVPVVDILLLGSPGCGKNHFPAHPRMLLLCYDITSKASVYNVQKYWRKMFSEHYPELEHDTPVMLLGLKRDARTSDCILPQEGLLAAQDMRADSYAECSALTGDLFLEALEDITKMAVGTTTEEGGLSKADETGCVVI